MQTSTRLIAACALSLAVLGSPAAFAQNHKAAAHAAACGPNTDPVACRKEASAARAAERRGQLTSSDNYQANAVLRCQRLPADQQDSCHKRVTQGKTTGSVETGGTLTELRETVPAKP